MTLSFAGGGKTRPRVKGNKKPATRVWRRSAKSMQPFKSNVLDKIRPFKHSVHSSVEAHLPALDMRLPFLQNLQLLHLSLGLVDAGAHGLHHLQRLLHQGVVAVLLRGPFQQLLSM